MVRKGSILHERCPQKLRGNIRGAPCPQHFQRWDRTYPCTEGCSRGPSPVCMSASGFQGSILACPPATVTCVLLQMVLHRAPRGCHSARVTHPFTAEHQLFAPSVAPNCLGSSDVLFNKNLYHRMTDVFLLGIWIKRHRSPGTCAEDQSTVAAESFHLKIQLAISLVLGGNH